MVAILFLSIFLTVFMTFHATSAITETRHFPADHFSAISFDGPFQVTVASVSLQNAGQIVFETPASLILVNIDIKLTNGILFIVLRDTFAIEDYPTPIRTTLTVARLNSNSLNGSATVDVRQVLRPTFFQLLLNGRSAARMTLQTDRLSVYAKDSSFAQIGGQVVNVEDLHTEGAARLNGTGLVVQDAKVNARDMSVVSLDVRRSLTGSAQGRSAVKYVNRPEVLNVSTQGMAVVGRA